MWHNVRAAALNATLQLLVIYRLVIGHDILKNVPFQNQPNRTLYTALQCTSDRKTKMQQGDGLGQTALQTPLTASTILLINLRMGIGYWNQRDTVNN